MKYLHGTQMSTRSLDERISSLAAGHHGVFSRDQALREGATPRVIHHRLATRRWEPIHPGVYRLVGVPNSWRQDLMAACLASGTGAVASHRSAGSLLRIMELKLIEISVPIGRRFRRGGIRVHEVAQLSSVDVTTIDAVPVTSPSRTLLDLAAVISEAELEEALDDALRRGLTSIPRLRWRAAELGTRRGSAILRRVLDARADGAAVPQSVLETRFLRLVKRGDLPLL